MSEVEKMKPITLRCGCGAYVQVMKVAEGWALGHLEDLDSRCIVADTLEEAVAEFAEKGIHHG